MTKGRSPNYPSVTLREAIDRIRLVYSKEHTHQADKAVVASDLGYSGLNGRSLPLIGALKRYGLLEVVGDGLKVTDEAVTILELAEKDPERIAAIERAAIAPPLFAELADTFGGSLPSDDNLRHYLIKKAFLPKAASDVIRIYRDNLELVSWQKVGYNPSLNSMKDAAPQKPTTNAPIPTWESSQVFTGETEPAGDVLSFNISRTGKAQVRFNGRITQEAIDKLVAHLNLSKDTYPTEAELEHDFEPSPDDMRDALLDQ